MPPGQRSAAPGLLPRPAGDPLRPRARARAERECSVQARDAAGTFVPRQGKARLSARRARAGERRDGE